MKIFTRPVPRPQDLKYPKPEQIKNLFEAWEKGGKDGLKKALHQQEEKKQE